MIKTLTGFLLIFVFVSCSEDVERQIQTDLIIESQQLLSASLVWGESTYFGMISLGTYQTLNSSQLPGCPLISLDSETPKVTLDFDQSAECSQAGPWKRTGKIQLEFTNSSLIQGEVVMTFIDYTFGGIQVKGTKVFTRKDLRNFAESSDQLILTDSQKLSHYLDIQTNHLVSFINLRPLGHISTGKIEGTNPAGRSFSIDLGQGRPYLSACLESNWVIPISGQETWTISRVENQFANYSIQYAADSACRALIQAAFPDGRTQSLTF